MTIPKIPVQWTAADIPSTVYASKNRLDIPDLDLAMQATEAVLPCAAWGAAKRTSLNDGMFHFYTDDERFSRLYSDCSPLLNTGVKVCIEPNFSVFGQMPLAVALFQIFKKRWLARFWQSTGIKIFVDLHVNSRYAPLNLFGVPKGWRAWATRGANEDIQETLREYRIALKHSETTDILFVVVGGGKTVQEEAKARQWIHIPETMDKIGSKGSEKRANGKG